MSSCNPAAAETFVLPHCPAPSHHSLRSTPLWPPETFPGRPAPSSLSEAAALLPLDPAVKSQMIPHKYFCSESHISLKRSWDKDIVLQVTSEF